MAELVDEDVVGVALDDTADAEVIVEVTELVVEVAELVELLLSNEELFVSVVALIEVATKLLVDKAELVTETTKLVGVTVLEREVIELEAKVAELPVDDARLVVLLRIDILETSDVEAVEVTAGTLELKEDVLVLPPAFESKTAPQTPLLETPAVITECM